MSFVRVRGWVFDKSSTTLLLRRTYGIIHDLHRGRVMDRSRKYNWKPRDRLLAVGHARPNGRFNPKNDTQDGHKLLPSLQKKKRYTFQVVYLTGNLRPNLRTQLGYLILST